DIGCSTVGSESANAGVTYGQPHASSGNLICCEAVVSTTSMLAHVVNKFAGRPRKCLCRCCWHAALLQPLSDVKQKALRCYLIAVARAAGTQPERADRPTLPIGGPSLL